LLTIARPFLLCAACLLTLAAAALIARAQTPSLQRFSPEGELFSVDMPKDPKVEESEEPYHRMTITTRLYLSASERGPVFAVASLRGIKVDPRMYTELQRFNSYDDAFRRWFPQKVRGKDAVKKFTLVGDKVLNGNPGREYRVVIGDLSGTAQLFLGKRFYAIVFLNTKKDDALSENFLASLVLPEKVVAQPSVATANAPNTGTTPSVTKAEGEDAVVKSESTTTAGETMSVDAKESAAKHADSSPPKTAGGRAPLTGGVLNGKAVYLPQPEYPPLAAQAKAGGAVTVQVVIDETGSVISAQAVAGHPLLQAACVAAARQARFTPTYLSGEPVKVTGVLMYNFVPTSN